MVCKNCGADLKPGIKYCLNCGNYIDDDDDEKELAEEMEEVTVDKSDDDKENKDDYELSYNDLSNALNEDSSDDEEEKPKKQRKKINMSLTDMLIYGGLILVIVISLIVILVSLATQKKTVTKQSAPEVKAVDNKVSIDNYTITFSGKLNYNQEKNIIYITDKENFTFSYRNKVDDYKKYATDLTILSKDLKNNGCNVISTETKKEGSTEFIIYKYKMSNETKYLYITPLKEKYVTMGVIDEIDGGQWENALTVIAGINSNIKFNNSDTDEIDNVINNSVSDISNILK